MLNFFEKLIMGVLSVLPSTIPLFVHSQHGVVVANASENLLASILAQFTPATPQATQTATPIAA